MQYPRASGSQSRDLAVAAATLIDKMRLESGESTSRTETVTQTEFDQRVNRLVEAVKAEASGDGD